MILPYKVREHLLNELRSNRRIPVELQNDLIELIDTLGVEVAKLHGYTDADIRDILLHVVLIRTTILQEEAWNMQGCCEITTEDIHSAVKLAIEEALKRFQPGKSKLKKEIASSFAISANNSASIISYIFIWAKKCIHNLLQTSSWAVKVDENGNSIGLKQYEKLKKKEKEAYQTFYIDFNEFDVYQTKSGSYKIVRKYED